MSVTMASVYLTIHLFGTTTKRTETQPFENMNQCVNSLEIRYHKYAKDTQYQTTFDREQGYLAISNLSDKTIQRHQCQEA